MQKSFSRLMVLAFAFALALSGFVPGAYAQDAAPTLTIGQSAGDYTAGSELTVTVKITYTGELDGLTMDIPLPDGWTYAGDGSLEGLGKPSNGGRTTKTGVEFIWSTVSDSPLDFQYDVNVPDGETGSKEISSTVSYIYPVDGGTKGGTVEQAEVLTVKAAAVQGESVVKVTHSSDSYIAGENLTVTTAITYTNTLDALGYQVTVPDGWALVSAEGADADVRETADGPEVFWQTVPASPVNFTYTVEVADTATGTQEISAQAVYKLPGDDTDHYAAATPLKVNSGDIQLTIPVHKALSGYLPGDVVDIQVQIAYNGTLDGLTYAITPPAGWTFDSVAGDGADGRTGQGGAVEIFWQAVPATPVDFTYTLKAADSTGDQQITASALYRRPGETDDMTAAAPTVTVKAGSTAVKVIHSANNNNVYTAGENSTVSTRIEYDGSLGALGGEINLLTPDTLTFISFGGTNPPEDYRETAPGEIEFWWTVTPKTPVAFTYTVNVAATAADDQKIETNITYNRADQQDAAAATPNPLVLKAYSAPPATYCLTGETEGNGTIFPTYSCVEPGDGITFTMTPAAGYGLYDLLRNGVSVIADVTANNAYTATNVSSHGTVKAVFKPLIQACTPENGSIHIWADGTAVIDSAPGYEVEDVQVGDGSEGSVAAYMFSSNACMAPKQAARSLAVIDPCWWPGACDDDTVSLGACGICATFAESKITATNGENGYVTVIVAKDGARQVTLIPKPGYVVDTVTIDGDVQNARQDADSPNAHTFTDDAEHTVHATFKEGTAYRIAAFAGNNGVIRPTGWVWVPEGDDQEFLMVPASGYTVASIFADGELAVKANTYTFENVADDHTISVNFEPYAGDERKIVATAGVGGKIEPAGTILLAVGADQEFVITPNEGYVVKDVRVDGESVGATGTHLFENVTADHTIDAVFQRFAAWNPSEGGRIIIRNNMIIIDSFAEYEVGEVMVNGMSIGSAATYPLASCFGGGARSLAALDPCWWPGACEGIACTSDCCADVGGLVCNDGVTLCANGDELSAECKDCDVCGTFVGCMMYAQFDESPITVSEGINGIVTVTVADGVRTASVFSDAGYTVDTITVDGEPVELEDDNTYTFAEGEHTMAVTFKPVAKEYTITATAGDGGVISPSGEVKVAEGANRAFDIKANEGFKIKDVEVDGESKGAVVKYTFEGVAADHAIHAVFEEIPSGNVYNITASAGYGGSISPSGTIEVGEGYDLTFTMTANYGYILSNVLVDGSSVGAPYSYTFADVAADHSIEAVFEPIGTTYAVVATADEGGSISPAGEVRVAEGGSITFTITPNAGYVIDDVAVDGVSVGAVTSYTLTNVVANRTIHATFRVPGAAYTITATAGDNGTIDPAGEVDVDAGASQTFVMVPDAGFTIADVLVDGNSVGPLAAYTFENVADDHTIHVSFQAIVVPDQYTITATAGDNGVISPAGEVVVNSGTNLTFTMNPARGYEVAEVLVDGASVGYATVYTFTKISADHTISVSFQPTTVTQYTITATAGANGAISPAGEVIVNEGESRMFVMDPADGYVVGNVEIDGVSEGALLAYTFTDVYENHTIAVTFKYAPMPVTYTITIVTDGSGTVTPSGKVAVYEGTSLTFEMTPELGYILSDFEVDGVSEKANVETDEEGVSTYTLSNITKNYDLYVLFGKESKGGSDDNCFISAAAGSAGSGSGLMLMLMTLVGGIAGIFFRKNS